MDQTTLRKARPYELDAHAAEIRDLVVTKGWKLKQVQDYFVRHYNLYATANIWKKRFRRSNLNVKNNRRDVMEEAAQHYQACLDSGEHFLYTFPGHKAIDSAELWRYARRNGWTIVEGQFMRPSAVLSAGSYQQQDASTTSVEPQDQRIGPIDNPGGYQTTLPAAQSDLIESDALGTLRDTDNSLTSVTIDHGTAGLSERLAYNGLVQVRAHQSTSTAFIESSSILADSRVTPTTAQAILSQIGNALCLSVAAPNLYRCHENFLRAIDVSMAKSFDSSHAILGKKGWLPANVHTLAAIDRTNEILGLFSEALSLSRKVQMRKAWRLYQIALSRLFFGLTYCLPVALWEFLKVSCYLSRIGGAQLLKTIAFHARKWCRYSLQGSHIQAVFEYFGRIKESHLDEVSAQALMVSYAQEKRVAGEFHTGTFNNYLLALSIGMQSDPRRLRVQLTQQLERVRNTNEITITDDTRVEMEMTCLFRLGAASYECGNFVHVVEIATEALEQMDWEEIPDSGFWVSRFACLLGRSLWELDDEHAGIKQMVRAVQVILGDSPDDRSRIRWMCRWCSNMHKALGDLSAAEHYDRLAEDAWHGIDIEAQGLEERFRYLAVDADGPGEGGNTASPARVDALSSRDQSTEAAWRPGVTSAEQHLVLSSLYSEDDGDHPTT